jgi:hypothetical protein
MGANVIGTLSGDLEYVGSSKWKPPCGCASWQYWTNRYVEKLWHAGDVRCHDLYEVNVNIGYQHHWIAYKDCKDPSNFFALDGWGWGDNIQLEFWAEFASPGFVTMYQDEWGQYC